jgi:hypothetical protein
LPSPEKRLGNLSMKVPSDAYLQLASAEVELGLFMKRKRKAYAEAQAQGRVHLLLGFLGKKLG